MALPSPMHESESEVGQSCPTLRDPMDCSLPGSSIHGIFQARVLEWGAFAFSSPSASPLVTAPVTRGEGSPGSPTLASLFTPLESSDQRPPISLEGRSKIFISPSGLVITVNLSSIR